MQATPSVSWGITGMGLIALALLPLLVFVLIVRPKVVLAFLGVGAVVFLGLMGLVSVRQGATVAQVEWQRATILRDIAVPTQGLSELSLPSAELAASVLDESPLTSTIHNGAGPVSATSPDNLTVNDIPGPTTVPNADIVAKLDAEYSEWLAKHMPFPAGFDGTVVECGWYSTRAECQAELDAREEAFLIAEAQASLSAGGYLGIGTSDLLKLVQRKKSWIQREYFIQERPQSFGSFSAKVYRGACRSTWNRAAVRALAESNSAAQGWRREALVLLGSGLALVTTLLMATGFACQVRARAERRASAASLQ